MITLLVTIFLLVLILGLCAWLLQMFPLPAPFHHIALAVLVLILVLVLVSILLGGVRLPLRL